MPRPIVFMACSAGKLARAAPALQLYRGVMWQTLRAHADPANMPHLVVLSARHGFVSADQVIEPYEQLMTAERSDELLGKAARGEFLDALAWPDDVDRILLAGGALYRRVMHAMVDCLVRAGRLPRTARVAQVRGGIGEQRSQLGRFLNESRWEDGPMAGGAC